MRAKLCSLHSPDIGEPLDLFRPPTAHDFEIFLQAEFKPDPGEGREAFGLTVCSPESLRHVVDGPGKGFVFLRHRLVVEEWNLAVIKQAIESLGNQCEAETWSGVAENPGRFMAWEFEDYTS